ncbi:MAG: hypothetical protein R2821_12675 [Flavobacteriaceae bacterium]
MKKSVLLILSLVFIFVACENSASKNTSKDKVAETGQAPARKMTGPDQGAYTPLTKQQATDFFPKQLGDYKLFHVDVNLLKSNGSASASYVKGNDFDHSLTYSLEDGQHKGSAILKNFEASYNSDLKGPEGTSYIKKERDNYKTISFLQPGINQYEIRFIYKNRFRLTLEGAERPDELWKYVSEKDLQKLDSY